jgi:hypothetical protein
VQFNVCGSVHHSAIRTKSPTRCNSVSEFYYPIFQWSSTCFGRHTFHHQEPKTAQAASGFAYVEGCRTCSCWTLPGTVCYLTTSNNCTSDTLSRHFAKLEAACAVLGSWWWAVCCPKHIDLHLKQGRIKVLYTIASCWVVLCKNCTMMHGSTNVKCLQFGCFLNLL